MTEAVPWWECRWLHHRHAVEDVHPLLEEVQRQRGTGFMTVEHVLAVLDAKDPDALVETWLPNSPPPQGRKLPIRERCQFPGCWRRKATTGPAAKWCADHMATQKRQAKRVWERAQKRPTYARRATMTSLEVPP